jgi:predicted neutral ceramidase superfamily lipid hydrolase
MGAYDWLNWAFWIAWLAWAALCAAVGRRLLGAYFARVSPGLSYRRSSFLAYAAMTVLSVVSIALIFLMFGEPHLHNPASLLGIFIAPFSVPLAVGCAALLLFELLQWTVRMAMQRLAPPHSKS